MEPPADPLAPLSAQDFEPLTGSGFSVLTRDVRSFDLELTQVERLPPDEATAARRRAAGIRQEPFTLVFHGPLAGPRLLPQGTYTLRHERLGSFAIFLVPRGPDERGHRYEAVFN